MTEKIALLLAEAGITSDEDLEVFMAQMLKVAEPAIRRAKQERNCQHEYEKRWAMYSSEPIISCKKCGKWRNEDEN